MVNRPPPRPGAAGKSDDNDGLITASSHKRNTGPRRGLEWSLRSMHKIDTSAQHFLNNYYGEDDGSDGDANSLSEDQTAYEIFKTKEEKNGKDEDGGQGDSVWASLNAPLRTGIVDGKRVVFELRTNVSKKPTLSRKERLSRMHVVENSKRSKAEYRIRFYLMHLSVHVLSVYFLAAFIAMNVIYAGFFYALEDKCCDDPYMSFGEVFAFSIQTSTTIGYGSMSPTGLWSNFLVVCLSYGSILMNTLFAGLLFTK